MSDVIDISSRKRKDGHTPPLVISRMVDGETVEYVNADAENYTVEKTASQHLRCDTVSQFKRPE